MIVLKKKKIGNENALIASQFWFIENRLSVNNNYFFLEFSSVWYRTTAWVYLPMHSSSVSVLLTEKKEELLDLIIEFPK